MKKITILASHLSYGGIERALVSLANMLISDYDVTIISAYEIYKKPVFEIDRNVKIVYLKKGLKPNKKQINECIKKHRYFKLIKELLKGRSILKEKKKLMIDFIKKCDSDFIISTKSEYHALLSMYGNKDSVKIGWEHNIIENKNVLNLLNGLDKLVVASKSQLNYYEKYFNKCFCIPDTIDKYPTKLSSLEEKNIIAVGKLSKEKGLDELLDAFKIISDRHPEWKLNIVGGGREYNNLKKIINKYNLNVELHGFIDREYLNKLYSNASICVDASHKELLGTVIMEAFSYGIPCIAFDRSEGAKQLISDNWDGYLVKYSDKEKMARRMNELIENYNRRFIMGRNGNKKVQKFNIKEIKKEWFKILK